MNIKEQLEIINSIKERLRDVENSIKEAGSYTDAFLKVCKKHKLTKVAIGVKHASIKSSIEWSGVFGTRGSVFSDGDDKEGWPTIWAVAKESGVGGGAGNVGQHQISSVAQARLIEGVYHYKNGKWKRLEGEKL